MSPPAKKKVQHVLTCPICILEVCSYLRHNKKTGAASCFVSLKAVTAPHLFGGNRLCLVFLNTNQESSARVQKEVERDGKVFTSPCVSDSPPGNRGVTSTS